MLVSSERLVAEALSYGNLDCQPSQGLAKQMMPGFIDIPNLSLGCQDLGDHQSLLPGRFLMASEERCLSAVFKVRLSMSLAGKHLLFIGSWASELATYLIKLYYCMGDRRNLIEMSRAQTDDKLNTNLTHLEPQGASVSVSIGIR